MPTRGVPLPGKRGYKARESMNRREATSLIIGLLLGLPLLAGLWALVPGNLDAAFKLVPPLPGQAAPKK